MKSKKIYKFILFVSILFIIIGILIFLYPCISNYFFNTKNLRVIRTYDEKISQILPEQLSEELKKAKEYNKNLSNFIFQEENNKQAYDKVLNIIKNGVMGYIEIPKILVNLPIYHGTSEEVLKIGIGHIENTSLPIGGIGNHSILARTYWIFKS